MAQESADRAALESGVRARVSAFRDRVRALPGGRLIWRVGVTVLGALWIVIGIVLLPLPGPGWLIIFAGLAVLATEYPWAARLLGWARAQVLRWTRWAGERHPVLRVILAVAALVSLAAVVLGLWWASTAL